MKPAIRIPGEALETMRKEARARYPEEACGYLLGREEADGLRRVVEARPVANRRKGERERRYLIQPRTVLRAEEEAAERGLEVLGFFHSHPDHPAEPSEFDREHAWPWYSYPIVPVRDGAPGPVRSWRLLEDRSGFREEGLESSQRTPGEGT